MASTIRNILIVCFFIAVAVCAVTVKAQETIHIYFETAKSQLSPQARATIDSSLYATRLPLDIPVSIYGYADSVGDTAYNRRLSMARALRTKEYLIQSGMRAEQIVTLAGMGEGDSRSVTVERGVRPMPKPEPQPAVLPKAAPKLELSKVKPGQTVVLENIIFQGGMAIILESSYPILMQLYETMRTEPDLKIRLEGHTCCRDMQPGSDEEDLQLSIARAKAVYTFLVEKGISPGRLSYTGFGGMRPRSWQGSHDYEFDRRVEIRIVDNP